MDDIFAPFRVADLQRYKQIHNILKDNGFTINDVDEYLIKYRVVHEWNQVMAHDVRCPECGAMMVLQALEENDCHWTCPYCRYGKYVPHSVVEELTRLGLTPAMEE